MSQWTIFLTTLDIITFVQILQYLGMLKIWHIETFIIIKISLKIINIVTIEENVGVKQISLYFHNMVAKVCF